MVLIVHGYAEHGGRYGHVAAALTKSGAVVCADDHLGHGRSDGERGLIGDFAHVVDDLHTLAGVARRDHPELPLVLVGHSMGVCWQRALPSGGPMRWPVWRSVGRSSGTGNGPATS
jgi:alpha-beta hydrolase superfamily lysophospholipase